MATKTTNLQLIKPDADDLADIAVINSNMDTLDTALSRLPDLAMDVSTSATTTAGTIYGVPQVTTSGKVVSALFYVNLKSGTTTLRDGLTMTIQLPIAMTSSSYYNAITIDGGATWKGVAVNAVTLVSSRYVANAVITLVYSSATTIAGAMYLPDKPNTKVGTEGCWIIVNDLDNNTTIGSQIYDVGGITAGENIYGQSLCYLANKDGRLKAYPLVHDKSLDASGVNATTVSDTATDKTPVTCGIDLSRGLYVFTATKIYLPNITSVSPSLFKQYSSYIDMRYFENYSTSDTLFNLTSADYAIGTAKSVYLMGHESEGLFYIDTYTENGRTHWLINDLPESDNEHIYLYVGIRTSNAYRMFPRTLEAIEVNYYDGVWKKVSWDEYLRGKALAGKQDTIPANTYAPYSHTHDEYYVKPSTGIPKSDLASDISFGADVIIGVTEPSNQPDGGIWFDTSE